MTEREADPIPGAGGEPAEPESTRRGFLAAVGACWGLAGAMIGVPCAGLFVAPLFREKGAGEDWIEVGSVEEFGPEFVEKRYSVVRQDGWHTATRIRGIAVRKGDAAKGEGEWFVLSTRCTHAGCPVSWQADRKRFFCPCHGGEFDEKGAVTVAPPDRPLDRLQVKAEDGVLYVKETEV